MSATASPTVRAMPTDRDSRGGEHRISIVVPFYNETECIAPLLAEVHSAMAAAPWPWEFIGVDDGSSDGTGRALREAAAGYGSHVRVIEFQRNFGQTAAMQAGIEAARGTVVVTLDGDLQNRPADIPALVAKLLGEDLDLVAGWRKDRQDAWLSRKVPSWIANRIIGAVTGVRLHDYGCSLKAYRAHAIKQLHLQGEMHRFIPAWIATVVPQSRIAEMPVQHAARVHGKSKYGITRTFRVIVDLLAVHFFLRYASRPGHFFGVMGLALGFIGMVSLAYLAWVKFALGESIGTRPMLLIGVVCVIAALQFLTTGVLAELMLRAGPNAERRRAYVLREQDVPPAPEPAWHPAAR